MADGLEGGTSRVADHVYGKIQVAVERIADLAVFRVYALVVVDNEVVHFVVFIARLEAAVVRLHRDTTSRSVSNGTRASTLELITRATGPSDGFIIGPFRLSFRVKFFLGRFLGVVFYIAAGTGRSVSS